MKTGSEQVKDAIVSGDVLKLYCYFCPEGGTRKAEQNRVHATVKDVNDLGRGLFSSLKGTRWESLLWHLLIS
jgi:hypothetical protein